MSEMRQGDERKVLSLLGLCVRAGKVIFGVGCGFITVLIRVFGNYPERVSFAILFMNILTPYISAWTRRRVFGGVKTK